jgi:hypothetical protein
LFDVCCADQSGDLAACDVVPLILPAAGELSTDQSVVVRGVSDRILAGTDTDDIPIVIVAKLDGIGQSARLCGPNLPSAPRATLPFLVRRFALGP